MTRRRLPPAEQMSPYFHKWLQWMETDQELSPNTVKSYGEGIRRLVAYAEISPSSFGPASFDQYSLIETMREMRLGLDVSVTTTRKSIYALKNFYVFCGMSGLVRPPVVFSRVLRLVPYRRSAPWIPVETFGPEDWP